MDQEATALHSIETRALRAPWLALVAIALIGHLSLSLTFPDAGWTTSAGVGANLAVALALCLSAARGASPDMRWRWRMLAALFGCWIGAYAAIAYLQSFVGVDPGWARFDELLYTLRSVPVLLLLSRTEQPEKELGFRRLDVAQAVLFSFLVFIMLFPVTVDDGDLVIAFVPSTTFDDYHVLQTIGLALLSFAGLLDRITAERRRFSIILCAVMVTYAVTSLPFNSFVLNADPTPAPGTWKCLANDVPAIVFVLLTVLMPPGARGATPPRRAGQFVHLLMAVVFCGASMLVAFTIYRDRPIMGIVGGLGALALYALRSALMQFRIDTMRRFTAAIVHHLPDAVCVIDPQGDVRLANDAAQGLFGGDVEGSAFAKLMTSLSPLSADAIDEIETSDGRTLVMSQAPVGTTDRIVQFTDVSRVRQIERDREEALQFLAHDIRAPQGAIVTLVDAVEPSATDDRNRLHRIRRYALHGLQLAEDFVLMARVRAAPIVGHPVDLADAAAEAADLAFPAARLRGIRIDGSATAGEIWVEGDHMLLVRAIHNLLDNATKFAVGGSVAFYRTETAGSIARFFVSSEGPALSPERLADPFLRFGRTSDAAGEPGVGLGLAFVQAVALRSGGSAFYERQGGCNIFGFTLPQR